MKLGDIYISKDNKIIQIDSFAHRMNNINSNFIIVFTNIERHNENEIGSCPSFNGYGTEEEIESNYTLLVSSEELRKGKYKSWDDIFNLIDKEKNILRDTEE